MEKNVKNREEPAFDWHEWKADIYKKPEDILRAFNEFNVCGKQIARIDVVGFASEYNAQYEARCALHNAGVPYEIIDNEEFAYSSGMLIPCSIKIIEPVILTFKDDSTLELQAKNDNSLKMSINQLNHKYLNGTNYSNVDANTIFRKLIGASISHLSIHNFVKETIDSNSLSKYIDDYRIYQFWTSFNSEFGFSINHHGWAWYKFEMRNQKCFSFDGNEIEKIPYTVYIDSFKKKRQILIVEGHDCSSYFWINPVAVVNDTNTSSNCIDEYSVEKISIEEDDVLEFLYYFLEKYFDTEIQIRDENCNPEFKWHLEHNIFTYDSVRDIISEIRKFSELFRTDFDNSQLDKLKKRFCPYTFSEREIERSISELSDNEKNEIYKQNIGLALDFYDRFCLRMELMMKHSPQYNLISFMGP